MTYRGLADSGLRQAGIGQAPVSHLTASTNRRSSYGILGLERMRWQIFKFTYRIPDPPRLVGIVYVFVTGAFFQIILSTEEYFTGGNNMDE